MPTRYFLPNKAINKRWTKSPPQGLTRAIVKTKITQNNLIPEIQDKSLNCGQIILKVLKNENKKDDL